MPEFQFLARLRIQANDWEEAFRLAVETAESTQQPVPRAVQLIVNDIDNQPPKEAEGA